MKRSIYKKQEESRDERAHKRARNKEEMPTEELDPLSKLLGLAMPGMVQLITSQFEPRTISDKKKAVYKTVFDDLCKEAAKERGEPITPALQKRHEKSFKEIMKNYHPEKPTPELSNHNTESNNSGKRKASRPKKRL